MQRVQRVAVYIDGLNLYYGMRDKGWRRYYWLDVQRLSESLLRPQHRLQFVRYFTAKLLPEYTLAERVDRQDAYLQALSSLPKVRIQYGLHIPKSVTCPRCGMASRTYEEKMTDVNIAVALLEDANNNRYDSAVVISADSDLTRPIEVVRQKFANKRVRVAFPPKRHSQHLSDVATASFHISRDLVRDSQLPDPVAKPDGYPVHKPARWR